MLDRLGPERSLHRKLRLGAIAVAAAVVALLLVVMLAYTYAKQRTALHDSVRVHADIVASNSAAALMFANAEEASQLLGSLGVIPDVIRAELKPAGGGALARYARAGGIACEPRSKPGVGWCSLSVSAPVMFHERLIGTVELEVGLDSIYRDMVAHTFFGTLVALLAIALSALLAHRIAGGIVAPLLHLTALTRRLGEAQDFSLRAEVRSTDETGELASSFNRLLEQLQWREELLGSELTQRRQAEEQLNRKAYFDAVTGLHNRHYFMERLERSLEQVRRYGDTCAVLFVDLDDFKRVNDSLGHEAGDDLLVQVGSRLRAVLRRSDILSRLGGDEFAVILENEISADLAQGVATKIVNALCEPFLLGGREARIGASIGICLYPEHASDLAQLMRNADAAMYQAKKEGKNRCVLYQHGMWKGGQDSIRLEQALRVAIENREFVLHFTPVIGLQSCELAGFEVQVRWPRKEHGLVGQAEFMPVAERSGLILALGEWVLRAAFEQAACWQRLKPGLRMAINVSPRQLRQPEFAKRIASMLEECGLAAELIDLECPEEVFLDERGNAVDVLKALREMGLKVVVAGFGRGFSCLKDFKVLPVDVLKIDRSLIVGVPDDEGDASIVSAVLAMARGLRLEAAADGVEHESCARWLRDAGCTLAQGEWFALPVDQDGAEELITKGWRAKGLRAQWRALLGSHACSSDGALR